jgi:hypothetical protein
MREPELVLRLMVVVVELGAADRLGALYTIPLVCGGLALAFASPLSRVVLAPEIDFSLFLPPIRFAAAYRSSWRDVPWSAANALWEQYALRQRPEPDSLDPSDRARDHADAHRRLRRGVPGVERTVVVALHDSGRIGNEAMHWVERNLDLAKERTGA